VVRVAYRHLCYLVRPEPEGAPFVVAPATSQYQRLPGWWMEILTLDLDECVAVSKEKSAPSRPAWQAHARYCHPRKRPFWKASQRHVLGQSCGYQLKGMHAHGLAQHLLFPGHPLRLRFSWHDGAGERERHLSGTAGSATLRTPENERPSRSATMARTEARRRSLT
jgi:hypothetical protein